jgi:tetratricopeptide (TPR) repeat protein
VDRKSHIGDPWQAKTRRGVTQIASGAEASRGLARADTVFWKALELPHEKGPKVLGKERSRVVRRIASQWANIESALLQGLQSSNPESAIRGALALVEFIRSTGTGSSEVFENAAAAAKRLGDARAEAECIKGLSDIALGLGDYEEAQARYEQAQTLCHKIGDMIGEANCIKGLGDIAIRRADNYVVEARYEQALAIKEKALGPEHPDVATSLNNLAVVYNKQRQYSKAEFLYQRALAIQEKVLAPDHPDMATSLENYATLLRDLKRLGEAGQLEVRARAIRV